MSSRKVASVVPLALPSQLPSGAPVLSSQLHPTRPRVVTATSGGSVLVHSTETGEVLLEFSVDQAKHGALKNALFFDASCLLHVSLLPSALVAEARANAVIAICTKGLYIFDCNTKTTVVHAPPVLATGPKGANSNGALSGACVAVSCSHVVVGTTFGSLLTIGIKDGSVMAFSGVSKVHEKSIIALVAIAGRPSAHLHRARIVSACQGGVVAAWEVMCETPIHRTEPRVLSQSIGSSVVDLRYDSSKNRLVCCFGNGSLTVWGFEENSQEETVVLSLAKGSPVRQCTVPRGSSSAMPDDALLVLSPKGKIMLALPDFAAIRSAKQLRAGTMVVGLNGGQSELSSRSLNTTGMAADHLVSIRTEYANNTEGAVVERFWEHPLLPGAFVALLGPKHTLSFVRTDYGAVSVQHESLLESKGILALDCRLIARSSQRSTSERVLAWLSPYSPSEILPNSIQDFSKADTLDTDIAKVLDLDEPIEELWPGPMSCLALDDKEAGRLLLGVAWRNAKRVIVVHLSRHGNGPRNIQVVQGPIEGATCVAFANSPENDGQILVLTGQETTTAVRGPVALTAQHSRSERRKVGGLAASFRSGRSFRGMTTLAYTQKKSGAPDDDEKTMVTEYMVCCFRLGDNNPISEVKLNQPVTGIFTTAQKGTVCDAFLLRADPPEHLKAANLKPWCRFYSLSGLVGEKKLAAIGAQLPAARLTDICVSANGNVMFALAMDCASVLIFEATKGSVQRVLFHGHVFTRSNDFTVDIRWHRGSLFIVTRDEVLLALVPSRFGPADIVDFPVLILAGRGRDAHPGSLSPRGGHDQRRESLHVHDDGWEEAAYAPAPGFVRAWEEGDTDETASFPVPVARPLPVDLRVLGVERESGALLLVSPSGRTSIIALQHPLIKAGMLAAAGFGASALQWTYVLPPNVQARNGAVLLLERMGFPMEASYVRGASCILLLDICIKHRLVDRAAKLFDARTNAFHDLSKLDAESQQQRASSCKSKGLGHVERLALLLASGGLTKEVEFISNRTKNDDRAQKFCKSLASVVQQPQQ